MGLLFVMPTGEEENRYVKKTHTGIMLENYGLPFLFRGYLAATFIVLFFLLLAVWGPMMTMMRSQDVINVLLSYVVFSLFCILPLVSLCFFYYKKCLIKNRSKLRIIHSIFGVPCLKRDYIMSSRANPFVIEHYLDSPNIAKMLGDSNLRAFQNQGYYLLSFFDANEKKFFLDRHSRKADLKKLADFLLVH